jgi:urease accessory protein
MKNNFSFKSKNSEFFDSFIGALFFSKNISENINEIEPFYSKYEFKLKDNIKLLKDQRCLGYVNLKIGKSNNGSAQIFSHREQGNLKARLIHNYDLNDELIIINTAGGLTSGDLNLNSIQVDCDTSLNITTQSMEKVYNCKNLLANAYTNIIVGNNSYVSWMPLETIFFNGGKLRRRLNIDLKPSSNFFGVETLIFGRKAMGEIVKTGELDDALQIYKNNKLLYSDFNKIKGNIDKKIFKSLVLKGNNIFCNVVYTGKKIRMYEKLISSYANKSKFFFGVSVVNGVLLIKILAKNILDIRDFLSDLVKIFGKNFNLPKIWSF